MTLVSQMLQADSSASTPTPSNPPTPPKAPGTVTSPLGMYTARLSEKKILNPKFHHLRFELEQPNALRFKAGQYVLLTVPTTPQKKSYSIVSAPAVEHAIEMLIDTAPDGHGTRYLTSLKPGDEVQFMAPVGMFTIAETDTPAGAAEKSLVFVATGSGIAPFKSIIEDLLITKNDPRSITLYWGLRFAQDQCWFDEFMQLAQAHPRFTFHPTLSQPPEEWQLCRGRVTDCLLVHPQPVESAGYYLCGNAGMIEDVKKQLLEKGVLPQNIHHEKFH